MGRGIDAHIAEVFSDRTYRDDLKLFVGRNAEAFLAFYDHQGGGRPRFFSAICWPAFFVPVAWYMYRRMYLYAGLIIILGIALGTLLEKLGSGGTVGISIALAGIAKPAYLAFAKRKIAKAGELATDEVDRLTRIAKAGGVSVMGAVIGTAITVLPIVLIAITARQS
jgi:hypothetical protein